MGVLTLTDFKSTPVVTRASFLISLAGLLCVTTLFAATP